MPDLTENINNIFSRDGLLSSQQDFEYRPQQQEMASIIGQSLQESKHTIIEAPTGVGKSLAYLIPSILYAKENKRKAIVSTCTINLQEQLINKDIPSIHKLLPVEFTSEILKGRNNYICRRRLNYALMRKNTLFPDNESEQLEEIYEWVQKNNKGTKQDMPFKVSDKVWSEIFAEQGICTGKSCGGEETNCFYQMAKNKVKKADLLVLNHYLFFTLFGMYQNRSDGYLFADDFVIFDEAHMLEPIASENISPSLSKEMVKFWLYKLYNPVSKKGFLGTREDYSLRKVIDVGLRDTESFFSGLENLLFDKFINQRNKDAIRLREPLNTYNSLEPIFTDICDGLKKMVSTAKNDDEENEITNYWSKFAAMKNTLNDFLGQKLPEHVYWVEVSRNIRSNTKINITPVDMAEFFRKQIFPENRMCVCTSATLSVNRSLEHFKKTIGAEQVSGIILDSPFDFARQMKIYISADIPEPKSNGQNQYSEGIETYEGMLSEKIMDYIMQTNGGSLVLFTNTKLLKRMYALLKPELGLKGIEVFAQGNGVPRNKLMEDFKNNLNSVLFGVDSFWMGVDIPGESLRNVIITKLPFDVPDHPIIEAKLENIVEKGGNPFYEYTIPGAVLKLKQGIGRLIRNSTDKGIVAILDSRIVTKSYGNVFIGSLPECEVIVDRGEIN